MLAYHVDDAFACFGEVAQRVLGVVEAARVADAEDGRVVVYYCCVAEGREVRGGALGRSILPLT